MTLKNCVANGVRLSALPGGSYSATWTLDSCYFTGDSYLDGGSTQSLLTDDAANSRRVLSRTRGTTAMTWDSQAVPSNWLTTLRMGAPAGTTKLGPFHYV